MAVETDGVIEALGLAPVAAIGFSDGGNVVLHLALQHPEPLSSMVLIAANFHHHAAARIEQPTAVAMIIDEFLAQPIRQPTMFPIKRIVATT
jgi:pimeloyl-ACP methyl ester carboxylesterase